MKVKLVVCIQTGPWCDNQDREIAGPKKGEVCTVEKEIPGGYYLMEYQNTKIDGGTGSYDAD